MTMLWRNLEEGRNLMGWGSLLLSYQLWLLNSTTSHNENFQLKSLWTWETTRYSLRDLLTKEVPDVLFLQETHIKARQWDFVSISLTLKIV